MKNQGQYERRFSSFNVPTSSAVPRAVAAFSISKTIFSSFKLRGTGHGKVRCESTAKSTVVRNTRFGQEVKQAVRCGMFIQAAVELPIEVEPAKI